MMDIISVIRGKLDKFNGRVMPNRKVSRGILNTEGLAFCALADHLKADLIVESGVCNGGSTNILGKYFPDIPIVSIDINVKMGAIIRTSIYHSVTLVHGDATVLLPQIYEEFSERRIAMLIDGPKGLNAINLAGKCFDQKNVVLIGIHDMFRSLRGKLKQDRILFDNLKVHTWTTDDKDYVAEFRNLDVDNDGSNYVEPDKYCSEKYGGYGPTIGFMLKG